MADYYISQGGSRILNATRVDQSGADNTNVIDWVKTNDFIIAININSNGKDTVAAQYKLRWRNKTDVGSFADVGAATEINYNATTDLVNGNPIAVGGRKCDSQGGDTWAAGEEVEGASLSDSIDLADEYETEIHFALDCTGATDEKEYEFELYDSTLGVTRGTCGATITMEAGAVEGWLSGWSYRKEISITGQSGAGTNYQVDFSIGDSAGGDFHLEGHCTNFPQDIEVTDNDGTTLLKFWIKDITADPLKMWVKVADDLGSNQTIYVYYGKSGATTNSNISNTFINGWDFEGDTIGNPPTGWVEDDANGDFHVIAGKKVNLLHANTDASLSNNYASITSITGNNDRIIEFDFESNRTDEYNYIILNDGTAHATEGIFLSIHSGNLYYYSGGWNSLIAVSINTIYHVKVYNIDLTNDQFDIDVDTVNKGTNLGFGAVQASLDYIHIEGGGGEDCDSEYDNIIIRKQTSPEPAFSSAGSEETPTAGNPYWYYQMLRRRN